MRLIMKRFRFMIFLCCCFCYPAVAAVRIGIPLFIPPYCVYDKVEGARGFDIDIISAICTRLTWQCQYVPMKVNKLFPALAAGKIDFAIGGLIITPERQKAFLFSQPYLPSYAYFLVLVNSHVKKITDLDGKRVGALQGREYINFLRERFNNRLTVVPYKLFSNLALDLKNDRVDAIFMNNITALFLKYQHPNQVDIIHQKFQVGNGMGIATTPGNEEKMRQINRVLNEIESDGTFVRIYNYNFQFFIPQSTRKK
ncbi:transporter substrate-binding domain-containing protein [Legionella spiritensis]|nr:transporter substrate-binding domain-containing protein [Legionella spiritensis]